MSLEVSKLGLSGAPLQRGRIHGEALRSAITERLGTWKEALGNATGIDPRAYLDRFLEETGFVDAILQWTPDLLEELEGISEAGGIDFNTILAHQFLDEEWWYRRDRRLTLSQTTGDHCSALGVLEPVHGSSIVAQNMDLPADSDGYQTLLHIRHENSELEILVFTVAGLIALNGLNNHSLGVCVNTLFELDHSAVGLPVAFAVRGLLARPTLQEAVAFLHDIRHASGQNYLLGGPDELLDFECSANRVVRFAPRSYRSRIYHTNHALVNDDQRQFRATLATLSPEELEEVETGRVDTEARYRFLESQLRQETEPVTVERVKTILSDHEGLICVHCDNRDGGCTVGSTIMELAPETLLHIAPGRPCSTAFHVFGF